MYYIFQEEEGTQVIFNDAFETEAELHQAIANPTLPIKFVYDEANDSYSHINGYDMEECIMIVNSLKNDFK